MILKYVTSISGIIDLLSFLPEFLPFFFPGGTVAFRMVRIPNGNMVLQEWDHVFLYTDKYVVDATDIEV